MFRNQRLALRTATAISLMIFVTTVPRCAKAQARDSHGLSNINIDETTLTLTPQPEPVPALKHRLIPSDFNRVDGNAAIYYLKAMGFLEQQAAAERHRQFIRENQRTAQEQGKDPYEAPPYSWLNTPPDELPIEEVKNYLNLLRFQPPSLKEAARRRQFDMDRRIEEVEDPMGYLLPEIQYARELARNQSIRTRLAIAEDRFEDAIEILGQQYALASHFGQDRFLVTNLVGISIASIASNDVLQLIDDPGAPNLYWALAALPDPLVDIRRSLAYEREFLFEQLKALRKVDEQPHPAGYWQTLVEEMASQLKPIAGSEMRLPTGQLSDELFRVYVVGAIAAAYPGAKRFLIEQTEIDRETINSYSTTQTVLLAMRHFHEMEADNIFKWSFVAHSDKKRANAAADGQQLLGGMSTLGWAAAPTSLFVPAVQAASAAQQRSEQFIALLRTVESIRDYAAANNSSLPESLDQLRLPAPADPLAGKPFRYERDGEQAVLSGHPTNTFQRRLILRISESQ